MFPHITAAEEISDTDSDSDVDTKKKRYRKEKIGFRDRKVCQKHKKLLRFIKHNLLCLYLHHIVKCRTNFSRRTLSPSHILGLFTPWVCTIGSISIICSLVLIFICLHYKGNLIGKTCMSENCYCK